MLQSSRFHFPCGIFSEIFHKLSRGRVVSVKWYINQSLKNDSSTNTHLFRSSGIATFDIFTHGIQMATIHVITTTKYSQEIVYIICTSRHINSWMHPYIISLHHIFIDSTDKSPAISTYFDLQIHICIDWYLYQSICAKYQVILLCIHYYR